MIRRRAGGSLNLRELSGFILGLTAIHPTKSSTAWMMLALSASIVSAWATQPGKRGTSAQ